MELRLPVHLLHRAPYNTKEIPQRKISLPCGLLTINLRMNVEMSVWRQKRWVVTLCTIHGPCVDAIPVHALPRWACLELRNGVPCSVELYRIHGSVGLALDVVRQYLDAMTFGSSQQRSQIFEED